MEDGDYEDSEYVDSFVYDERGLSIVYKFRDFEDIISLTPIIKQVGVVDEVLGDLKAIVGEYGESTKLTENRLIEYGKVICSRNAIDIITSNFGK